jgi:predicted P-loop ATPase
MDQNTKHPKLTIQDIQTIIEQGETDINPDMIELEDQTGWLPRDYRLAFQKLGYTIKYNMVKHRPEISGGQFGNELKEIRESLEEVLLREEIREYIQDELSKAKFAKTTFKEGLELATAQNTYHPIKETLEGLRWDGVPRLDTLCSHFKDRHGVFPEYFKHFIFSCVERVYDSSHQNPVLVLDGPQKIGKSYFVSEWLPKPFGNEYFRSSGLNPDSKDDEIALSQVFLWEWGEAKDMSKRTAEALKQFLTKSSINVRLPYERNATTKPTLANIIITKNFTGGGYLQDMTGNRRFHVVDLESIDKNYSKTIRPDQIWAEVYHLWKEDKNKTWKQIDETRRDEINETKASRPAIWEYLDEILEHTGEFDDCTPTTQIYNVLQTLDRSFSSNRDSRRVDEYMKTTFDIQKGRGRAKPNENPTMLYRGIVIKSQYSKRLENK